MSTIAERLRALNISLPEVSAPAANYVPYVISGQWLVVSGQLPFLPDGIPCTGKLGETIGIEEGRAIARNCGINLLACVQSALGGDWNRLARCVRIGVFVSSSAGFTDQPLVANGVSDLMVEVLGEAGRHARAAVGVSELPRGVAVEAEGIFELRA